MEIKRKVDNYIAAWVGIAMDHTDEKDAIKFRKLCQMIAKKMVETKKPCKVNYIKKTIKVRESEHLTDLQLEAALFILENPLYLKKKVEYILKTNYNNKGD